MELQLREGMLLLILTIAAYQDVREKKICVYLPIVSSGLGIVWRIIHEREAVPDILLGSLVGVVLLLISWVSNEKVGIGDGLMLVVSGIFVGLWMNLTLVMLAFGMVGFVGLYLFVVKKKGKDYRLPFLPYLLVAYLCLLL